MFSFNSFAGLSLSKRSPILSSLSDVKVFGQIGQAMKARKTGVIVVGHLALKRKEAPKFSVKVN